MTAYCQPLVPRRETIRYTHLLHPCDDVQFGTGFYRRHPTQISNPRADVIKAHGTEWAARAQTINEVCVNICIYV